MNAADKNPAPAPPRGAGMNLAVWLVSMAAVAAAVAVGVFVQSIGASPLASCASTCGALFAIARLFNVASRRMSARSPARASLADFMEKTDAADGAMKKLVDDALLGTDPVALKVRRFVRPQLAGRMLASLKATNPTVSTSVEYVAKVLAAAGDDVVLARELIETEALCNSHGLALRDAELYASALGSMRVDMRANVTSYLRALRRKKDADSRNRGGAQ